jgi:hypothetical protein
MNNILEIKTPAQGEATALRSDYGLENHGLSNLHVVYWNLPTEADHQAGPSCGLHRETHGSLSE